MLNELDVWVGLGIGPVEERLAVDSPDAVVEARLGSKTVNVRFVPVDTAEGGVLERATEFWNGTFWSANHEFVRNRMPFTRYSDDEIRERFAAYRNVNSDVAAAVADVVGRVPWLAGGRGLVLTQDYQMVGVGAGLPAGVPRPGYFLHTPWASPDALVEVIPADVLGELTGLFAGVRTAFFHTRLARDNFLDTVARFTDARVDRVAGEVVWPDGAVTIAGTSAITTDPGRFDAVRGSADAERWEQELRSLLAGTDGGPAKKLVYAGGRGDPSKNWLKTLLALRRAIRIDPETMRDVVVVFNEEPTRQDLDFYREHQRKIDKLVAWVQARGVTLINKGGSPYGPMVGFKLATAVLLPTGPDGWNLMAVEAVMEASLNEGGNWPVPILGEAGVRELLEPLGAVTVDPRDSLSIAKGLLEVLQLDEVERRTRSARMQSVVWQRTTR
ncbi:MAG: trehalose-6-phosphate synthase, partial [Nocardioides sp.]